MNKNELESLAWLYFDGEISESDLARLRRGLASSAENRAIYARLHRLHLATVVAVCGRTVDLRAQPQRPACRPSCGPRRQRAALGR